MSDPNQPVPNPPVDAGKAPSAPDDGHAQAPVPPVLPPQPATPTTGAAAPSSPQSPAVQAPDGVAAPIEKHRLQLFDLYKKFRYNDLAFSQLSRQAYKLEGKVRWSVLITLAVSLLTDIIPGMNAEALRWIWGALGALATVLTIYAMSVQSGEQQFKWFELAKRARAWASKLESFTAQVEEGKVDEKDFSEAFDSYNKELNSQFSDAGPRYIDFEAGNRLRLTDELMTTLRSEGKAR